jgi:hypothetical protein
MIIVPAARPMPTMSRIGEPKISPRLCKRADTTFGCGVPMRMKLVVEGDALSWSSAACVTKTQDIMKPLVLASPTTRKPKPMTSSRSPTWMPCRSASSVPSTTSSSAAGARPEDRDHAPPRSPGTEPTTYAGTF